MRKEPKLVKSFNSRNEAEIYINKHGLKKTGLVYGYSFYKRRDKEKEFFSFYLVFERQEWNLYEYDATNYMHRKEE